MDEFDYVIVGSGPAGCVLAKRLTEDGNVSVCVLEAGGKDSHPYLAIPGGFVKGLYSGRYTRTYNTEPSAHIAGRSIAIPQGQVVGGSSSINGLVFNRGRDSDFDHWEALGNPGWGYRDLLPYFKKAETAVDVGDDHYRGRSGGQFVTNGDWRHPLCEAFLESAVSLGFVRNPDYNGATAEGSGYFQRMIHKGLRISAARAFLRPALAQGSVDLRVRCLATTLVFEDQRAVGVDYTDASGLPCRVTARHEVLLAAGTVNTPKLLQLSGVGPGTLLQQFGIPVARGLAGVGENLRDHYSVRVVSRAKNITTINEAARWPRLGGEIVKWALGRPSILAVSPSVAYVNCSVPIDGVPAELKLLFSPASYKEGKTYVLDDFPGMICGASQQRPRSVGYLRISSADPRDPPVVQPNYLAEEYDQKATVAGLKLVRKILHGDSMERYYDHETLPGDQAATDDALLDFARRRGTTGYHLVGTCRMGADDDPLAVVDSQLRVRGFSGLRVVDASVMPMIPAGNTYAATLAVAEKAADMIRGRNAP